MEQHQRQVEADVIGDGAFEDGGEDDGGVAEDHGEDEAEKPGVQNGVVVDAGGHAAENKGEQAAYAQPGVAG